MPPSELILFALAAWALGAAALVFLVITIGRGLLGSRPHTTLGLLSRRVAMGIAVVVTGELVLYLVWPFLDDNDAPPTAEHQLATAAALLLLGLPHAIAWWGRRYPHLLTVAGAWGIVLTLISVMGHSVIFFTVPFVLIPSVFYLARGLTRRPRVTTVAGTISVVTVLALGAAAALFMTEDPRCSISIRRGTEIVHTQPTVCDETNSGRMGGRVVGGSSSSDTVALHESLLSLSLSGLALAWCVWTGRQAPTLTPAEART